MNVPLGKTFLHIERCWQGKASNRCSGSRALVRLAQPLPRRWVCGQAFPKENVLNGQIKEKFSLFTRRKFLPLLGNGENFMTALALGDDYRAALTMFFSSPAIG